MGALESQGNVSLFCGSLALLGCIGFFFTRRIPRRIKVITGAFLAVTLMLFYWQPFVFLFSLLKTVASYWYRYSYIGIFTLLLIAAQFFSVLPMEKKSSGILGKASVGFALALLALDYVHTVYSLKATYFTVFLCLCTAAAAALLCWCRDRRRFVKTAALLLAAVVCMESVVNAYLVLRVYGTADAASYTAYVEQQEKQIAALQDYDNSFYRVSQTSTRIMNEGTNLTANYNEAFAFHYPSIAGYTSVSDNNQREFLDHLGYRCENLNTMNIVNTSILSADSLLGVKYILSNDAIGGLQKIDALGCYNGKYVYENPYCLPMAFVFDPAELKPDDQQRNPFLYQNALYSYLMGKNIELFKPVPYDVTAGDKEMVYHLTLPEGNIAVYGYIDADRTLNGMLYTDGVPLTGYAMWKSPRVFYVDTAKGASSAEVRLEATGLSEASLQENYYYLDLDIMQEVASFLSARAAQDIDIQNGAASCRVTAEAGQKLYLSIPRDDGWKVTLNGKTVQPDSLDDCMMILTLEAGQNAVSLTYTVPGLYIGLLLTVLSLAICGVLFVIWLNTRKRRTKR